MNIIGIDELIFGVDDYDGSRQFTLDFGLNITAEGENYVRFSALDGSGLTLRQNDDPSLPQRLASGNALRKTVYGCADQATVNAIAEELSKDREVKHLADGSIEAVDDCGFCIGFQVSIRNMPSLSAERINSPGAAVARYNDTGVVLGKTLTPRTLSHVVYFLPDTEKAEKFYVERLGFQVTDRYTNLGPFLRPAGTQEHHTLFMIRTPPHMIGIEHFAFHMEGPTEVLMAGSRMSDKGYSSFWGPGRHIFASNWFWYFNAPWGCHIEFDADMDILDETWQPRETIAGPNTAQAFLFEIREKWAPTGPPPPGAH